MERKTRLIMDENNNKDIQENTLEQYKREFENNSIEQPRIEIKENTNIESNSKFTQNNLENQNKFDLKNNTNEENDNLIKDTEIKENEEDFAPKKKKTKTKLRSTLEWMYCIIIAIVLALLFRYYIGTPTVVKQVSMYPTLEQNQRLWLNRWGRTTSTLPNRGDIITFEEPSKISYSESEINIKKPIAQFYNREGWDWFVNNFLEMGDKKSYIKRVVGLPGEHIKIENGKVYINDKEYYEDYLQPGVVTDVVGVGFSDFVVPENCVFAMGDNRNRSTDCRAFGCIPLEKIESTVAFRFWPFDKFGEIKPVK